MFRASHWFAVAVVCLGLTSACSSNKTSLQNASPAASRPEVVAPTNISESFAILTEKGSGRSVVAIRKNALEKEFLFQGSIAAQHKIAWSSGLQSRVVAFRERDGKLILLEATQGHTVTQELPQNLVIATFTKVETREASDEWIAFDFGTGMNRVPSSEDWHASDSNKGRYSAGMASTELRSAFLEDAKLTNNRIVLRQIGQTNVQNANTTVELKYYLSPYQPDPTFEATESHDFDRHGFFEVAPSLQLSDGTTVIRASKFNSKKPIVFAVSANTPAHFKQAVRDGVLYWNRAEAGLDIRVVDAPPGVTAPNIDYNVVQWIDWDDADMAYADGQMDPRTGEILHAQIFLPSVFAFSSAEDARKLLHRTKANGAVKHPFLHQGEAGGMVKCDLDSARAMGSAISRVVFGGAAPAAVLRASQDMVRSVAAHEVGHALGLRHNFAGSLSAKNYKMKDANAIFSDYLAQGTVPSAVETSSSVMDYLRFQESALVGHRMAQPGLPALEHDAKALQALYQRKVFSRSEMPVFCTDTDKGSFVDCTLHDAGNSAVEYAAYAAREAFAHLHYEVFEKFVAGKVPPPGSRPLTVDRIPLNPDATATKLLSTVQRAVGSFGSSTGFISVRRKYGVIDELNEEEVKRKEFEYFVELLKEVGGGRENSMEEAFRQITAEEIDTSNANFTKVVREALAKEQWGPRGAALKFTEDEAAIMDARVTQFYARFPNALAKADQGIWTSVPNDWKNTRKSLVAPMLLTMMDKRVREYVLAEKTTPPQTVEVEIELVKKTPPPPAPAEEAAAEAVEAPVPAGPTTLRVTLTEFAYPTSIRVGSPKLLASGTEEGASWGVREKAAAKTQLLLGLKKAFGGVDFDQVKAENIKSVKPADKTQALTDWIVDNKRVVKEF